MSGYATGTKLSELTLDGDPLPTVEAPAVEGAQPTPVGNADPVAPPTSHSAVVKASLLRLADAPAETVEVGPVETGTRAHAANAGRDADARSTDEFVATAERELQTGDLDKPLWAKAMELAGHDVEVAKPAYLRARATALRIAKQKKRAEAQAARARELAREEKEWVAPRPAARSPSRRVVLIGGGLAAAAVLLTGYLLLRPSDQPSKPSAASAPATKAALPSAAKGPAGKSGAAERATVSGEDFAKKVAELKSAGNWNVLVLYAVEWTRKVPDSADAWNELSLGYVKLRQFSEALDAATKTVQLAPASSQAWQTLGDVNAALDRPIPAIAAYEHAVALNSRDVSSLVQLGTLQAQFGHLPEARVAFAQALDVSPTDSDALCGATSVAQKEGRAKDAETFARQLKAADLRCREPVPAAPPPAAVAPPAPKKPTPATKR